MMKPMRFPAASTRYAPAVEPKALAPAGSVVAAETVEFDEDGRRLLTSPLAAPARPVPTVMPPPRAPARPLPQASGSRLPPGKFPPATGGTPPSPDLAAALEAMKSRPLAPSIPMTPAQRYRATPPKKQAIGADDIPF